MIRAVALVFALAGPCAAQDITRAIYDDPTTRYPHGALGDEIEYGALVMETRDGRRLRITLPERRVFEDTAPRLADVDGDGQREVIVVESDAELGARLAIYNPDGLVAATGFIGRRNRWLAPVGVAAADLDGDGRVEFAFVDRPHLAKTLKVYEFRPGELKLEGSFEGVTNHRIGERDIAGGIRSCAGRPEMIVADAGWSGVLALHWDGTRFGTTRLGPHQGRSSFAAAMDCQ